MNRNRQKGFALIEVLVSLLIFALGVLGVAGMQGQAIRVTHDSSQRSQATWLAHEATERIKVNPGGLDSGVYQSEAQTASSNIVSYCGSPPSTCIGTTCSVDDMARYDVFELMCDTTGLINQQITIACSAAPCVEGSNVDISVSWDSRGATAGVFAIRQQLSIRTRR